MQQSECEYVHGYSAREHERLVDQATTLTDLLHSDTTYPADCSVLEAGCGVGAQTVALTRNSPETHFTCIDLSEASLEAARTRVESTERKNVTFQRADIFNLPFPEDSFDHIFVCFVLEHLENPVEALLHLKAKLKPGGTITVIAMVEGVRDQALSSGIIRDDIWERGIKDLYRTTEQDGTFCYTFFKGIARK
ncbi:MAG: class I SAM-dependent methyltransferase [Pseudomonadota bacterium]